MSRAVQNTRPTIDDVARVAGVSRATASRALNGQPGASAASRERVAQAVAQLGYRADEAARELASGRRRTIDLVIYTCEDDKRWLGADPYYGRILAGLLPALDREGLPLHIRRIDPEDALSQVVALAAQVTAGAVLVSVPPALASRFTRRARGPVVSLTPAGEVAPTVSAANRDGAAAAIGHLKSLGRRRIAAVHGPDDNECAVARRLGHIDAAAELGIPVIEAPGDFDREGGYRATVRLLESHPDLDGLFVTSDVMAAGAVQALTDHGRRIPQDVALVGFDDSIAATYANPPLTTIRQPVEDMAAAAIEALLSGTTRPGWHTSFTCDLVQRASA